MKKVSIFVEGPSDKASLIALLQPLIVKKYQQGIYIQFFDKGGKRTLMKKIPGIAVNILRNEPSHHIVVLPDLYPAYGYPSFQQLKDFFITEFKNNAISKGIKDLNSLLNRFHFFCLKYELEVLILAIPDYLKEYLKLNNIKTKWKQPVEEQNFTNPPSKVVEKVFHEANKKYVKNIDAAMILAKQDYKKLADICSECFSSFVWFIESL